jgi:hypothetical protein
MPFDGFSYNPPQRQPVNASLAVTNAAVNAFLKANNLTAGTPCRVAALASGELSVTVDREAAANNERISAARGER